LVERIIMNTKHLKISFYTLSIIFLLLGAAIPASSQEDISDFTQTFQVFMQSRDAFKLYDITPDDVVYALPETYKLGPGDILQVILSGMINDALVVQVGPQGDIYVPPAGLLKTQDMTVAEARDLIDSELGKYLLNYQCDLQLLKARRIQVYMLGQVRQPGQYIALAGTTAISVIQTAGSLVTAPITVTFDETKIAHPYFKALTSGAGRYAEIYRNGERVGRVDLARVAIGGRARGDLILEDGDSIYIPGNEHPVIIRGGVSRPGTYEMRRGDTVIDLISQAGGLRSLMILGKVTVERQNPVGSESPTSLIDLDLADPNFDPSQFSFQAGDILRVPEINNQVFVMGGVWMPQSVDYHEGWTVMDYIAETGGPVAPADVAHIVIVKFPLTDEQTETVFSLKNMYLGEEYETVPIDPGDMIWVPWKNQPYYGGGVTNAISVILGQTLGLLRIINDLP